ncbi:MAG: LysM peptidoglycan-binding domain-containing protein [Chloroflexi bacterium]|nr:LysM peptidoglycan-binding domain-containing protein [Chloroflexota bacterium]
MDLDQRCPNCDSRLPAGSDRCLMCGYVLPPVPEEPAGRQPVEEPVAGEESAPSPEPEAAAPAAPIAADAGIDEETPEAVVTSVVRERQSAIVFWMTAIVAVLTVLAGAMVLQYGGPVQLALLPTSTPLPATATATPTVTLPPSETPPPSAVPSETPPPAASATPQPPRSHNVAAGDTLFGLSLIYNVSMESIAELNGFSMESPIQSGQVLQMPWPTATPPLEPVAVDINGEIVIADPTDCRRYEIQEGDALSVIAARENINMQLLLAVNRLTEQSIVQPGDTICIPNVIHGDLLPPTPGPSPTPGPTEIPRGPRPLYPPSGSLVESGAPVLQWVAIKDLEPDEWYMVTMTDISEPGLHPQRGFTRQTSFQVPTSWRPPVDAVRDMEWNVTIVRVTGQRADGSLIYTFGGRSGDTALLSWLGAVPTPTPTPTPTPQPEAS